MYQTLFIQQGMKKDNTVQKKMVTIHNDKLYMYCQYCYQINTVNQSEYKNVSINKA